MATITIKDGLRYVIKSEQVIDGQVVTAQAIRENPTKYGISEIQIEDRKDDRYYFINELQAAPYIEQTAKDLDQCKSMLVAQIKQTANSLLSASDWKITREDEGVKPCDQATKDYRAAVRAASNANEALILAAVDVDALAAVVMTWPEDPANPKTTV